ncbi:hypothetical protein EMCRGX_G011074 [Ephydatia muelleri]
MARQKRYGQYAESSSKTLIGLQKVNVQLQKEIDSIEKQKKTAVNNIANHQQALKMSWRRLEQQRNMASSPLLTRATTAPSDANPRQPRKGILQSNTRLYVNATPQVYDSTSGSSSAVQLTVTPSEDETESASIAPGPDRRQQTLPRIATPSSLASGEGGTPSDGKIVDKQALMEASMLLGVNGTSSKGPGVFQSFYNSDAGNLSVRSIVVSPVAGNEDEEQEEKKDENQSSDLGASSEPSLAEMFEQIKHCRYIRHYRPDGTEIEEYD